MAQSHLKLQRILRMGIWVGFMFTGESQKAILPKVHEIPEEVDFLIE